MSERSLQVGVAVLVGFGLLLGLSLGLALLLIPSRAPAPVPGSSSAPTPELIRSARLELAEVAPLGTAAAQLAWVVAPVSTGWDAVVVPPAPALRPLQQAGAALFTARCAECHGSQGRGDGRLASWLARPPRDLARTIRTRRSAGPVSAGELFRTLTVGAPRYGMPSFAHLPAADRWALVAHLLRDRPVGAGTPVALPARPERLDLHLGQDVFRARCASCHGVTGDGRGEGASGLVDEASAPCPPTDLRFGPGALRAGRSVEALARTIVLGRPGTPMPPTGDLSPAQLWGLAAYVARVVRDGGARRRVAWSRYFAAQRPPAARAGIEVGKAPRRWSRKRSARFAAVPAGKPASCLGCHEGIEPIAEGAMAAAIDAVAGGDAARGCAVCHGGSPTAGTKVEAHRGMAPNPGSLWVTSVGAGCAQCHSRPGALTTLHGRPLPEPVGGRWMHVVSHQTDPSGASSGNYTYRVQRSLMAQETGKVLLMTTSAGLAQPDAPRFSDFPMDDPDGAVPTCGNQAYLAYVQRALKAGYMQRLPSTRGVPTVPEILAQRRDKALAGYVDYFRKQCARCHLWGEGMAAFGEHRSAGCSACHVVWNEEGRSESGDPTIPPRAAGHPQAHRLVLSPPDQNCYHCHTRGPLTIHSEPHQRAGLGCGDCHTSIDVHGDGNPYPAMEHQVEVRCEDCHGDERRAPWELPVGHGGPVPERAPRGTFAAEGRQHLRTHRGNARTRWLREGDDAVVVSLRTGRRHRVPLLKQALGKPDKQTHGELIEGHGEVSCALCHNTQAPRCGGCHVSYFSYLREQDWLLSAWNTDPATTRQRAITTLGRTVRHAGGGVTWGPPDTRRDRDNKLVPMEPGCKVLQLRWIEKGGEAHLFTPRFNPGQPSYPPIVTNSHPHENAIPPRTCADCHEGGVQGARVPKATLPGHVQPDRGDWWRKLPPGHPSQAAKRRWKQD